MYYAITSLHAVGNKLILHYFHYNAERNIDSLKKYCEGIYTYSRKSALQSLPLTTPHIVASRINQELIKRLNKDDYAILLEGLHCSGIIPYINNPKRVVIRMHNDESLYYRHLAKAERNLLKKIYYKQESRLLRKYQWQLPKDTWLACLSETDQQQFSSFYHFYHLDFIPCFIPWQTVSGKPGKGAYCLYHGNMQVAENREAVSWLINEVFSQLKVPFIIAGKGIPAYFINSWKEHQYISWVNNPSIEEVNTLVREAQIHVLPSMNATGVKLKLLHALLNGRFCITNQKGIEGSCIKKGAEIKETASQWKETIVQLMNKSFTAQELQDRQAILQLYDNHLNARKLNALW